MNQEPKIIGAIDIGTTKTVAIAGRKYPDGRIDILGLEKIASTGVKRGIITNVDETVTAIRQAVTALQNKLNIILTDVYVGMEGYTSRSFTNTCYKLINRGDEIKNFDIEQLHRDAHRVHTEAGEKIIHVIPQDYTVDTGMYEKNPVGMTGRRLEGHFHVVTVQTNACNNIEKCIQRAGLKLLGIILQSLASAHAVLSDDEREAGVVLVDIGGGATDVSLFYNGAVRYSATIPFGGNVVTTDVKEGCSLLLKQAEAIKIKFGSAMDNMSSEDVIISLPAIQGWEPKEISCKNLAFFIRARMEEIIDYILEHIKASGYYEKLGAGIVITGGGARLNHVSQLIKLRTGIDVRMGCPALLNNDTVSFDEMPAYATAVGLLICPTMYVPPKVEEQTLFVKEPVANKPEKVKEKKPKPGKKKENPDANSTGKPFFDRFKEAMGDLFNTNDTEM
ncbi:MAG: cell division protein FtsA [Cytophagaceae bacterium]|jgi:cell division protein FtsA|nr:cell division protein FtsA [Cytophagaceae bacterium]